MIKAVIFDLDGLLVDTESLGLGVASDLLRKKVGREVDVSGFIGRRSTDFFAWISEKENLSLDVGLTVRDFRKAYVDRISGGVSPLSGAVEIVNALQGSFKIALVTGSIRRQVDIILAHLGLTGRFSVIVTGDDVKIGKPDPEPYVLASSLLNIAPEYCLVFEDSGVGVMSAKSAGMKCVGVKGHPVSRQDFSKADLVIDTLEEINEERIREF